jgi:nucleotide-binding universal stress UspA family protein
VISDVQKALEIRHNEILVPVANPVTAQSLVALASDLARGQPGTEVTALKIVPVPMDLPLSVAQEYLEKEPEDHQAILDYATSQGSEAGIQVKTSLQPAYGIASGIAGAAKSRPNTRLILLGWHGPLTLGRIGAGIDKAVVQTAPCDVAVYLEKSRRPVRRILVPAGGGPHARLGLRLAYTLAAGDATRSVVVLRVVPGLNAVDVAAEEATVHKLLRDELGEVNGQVSARVVQSPSVMEGILSKAQRGYDLVVIGASEEWFLHNLFFGSIPDRVAERAPCSVLLVRKHELTPVSWLRRMTRRFPK